jgi:hypothetical protein
MTSFVCRVQTTDNGEFRGLVKRYGAEAGGRGRGRGVRRGVFKGVEDGRRSLARRAYKGRAWRAQVKL